MKTKKNIIKKIELNKNFKFLYRKEFKHYLKETRFKNKFFFKIAANIKYLFKLNKLVKLNTFYNLNINKNFLINKHSYFNFITNDLNLKYNNISLNIDNIDHINDFYTKKTILLFDKNIEIINYQKFINFIDNNYVLNDNLNFNEIELFLFTNNIFYCFLKENYKFQSLLLLNNKCF